MEQGDLPGRRSVSDLPEHHRLIVRVGLYSPRSRPYRLRQAKAAQYRLTHPAQQTHEQAGDKAAGMTGQDIVVQRRIVPAERGLRTAHYHHQLWRRGGRHSGRQAGNSVGGLLVETDAVVATILRM